MMIDKFSIFNEAKVNPVTQLLTDVTAAFAYIVDENPNVKIVRNTSQVSVYIPSLMSSTKVYSIGEYSEIHNTWNEMVQDIDVAVQQLTTRGNISVETNTSGTGIRVIFYISENSKLFKINPKSITVSKIQLIKEAGLPSDTRISVTNRGNFIGTQFEFGFSNKNTTEINSYLAKLVDIFNKYKLNLRVSYYPAGTIIYPYLNSFTFIKEPVINSVRTGELKRFVLRDTV